MNSYHSHIVDLLVQNIYLNRTELFEKLGMENRREFRTMVDRLMKEKRIRYESDINGNGPALSPKVLKLVEFENRNGQLTRVFNINYVPTAVLEKELEYVNPDCGDPFEDTLDFHLEIMGYKLEEKYKTFFESENGFTLDFSKFRFYLWAEYLFHKYNDAEPKANPIILYVDEDMQATQNFISKMKEQYVPNITWRHFLNSSDASFFLENTLHNRTFISLIILRAKSTIHTLDFILKFQELIAEFDSVYSRLIIPVMILEEPGCNMDFTADHINKKIRYLHYPAGEDEYILGNVMKSICENP